SGMTETPALTPALSPGRGRKLRRDVVSSDLGFSTTSGSLSPGIHRWVGTRICSGLIFSFAPSGLWALSTRDPRLKPWATFGRPWRDFRSGVLPRFKRGPPPAASTALLTLNRYAAPAARASYFPESGLQSSSAFGCPGKRRPHEPGLELNFSRPAEVQRLD